MEKIRALFARDRFVELIGVELKELKPGYARSQLVVTDKILNGKDLAQGGSIFTLGDFTMAAAANSHGQVALTVSSSITYLKPALFGSTLTAVAIELSNGRRMAHYRVDITNEKNELIAVFNGSCSKLDERIGAELTE